MASTSTNRFPTSPPISVPESFSYDVFLSFRGKDTRNNFSGVLNERLILAGMLTFMDDSELHKGREIALQLMKAIEESRTYIVIFSQNYASSRWCLDELVSIINQCDKHKMDRVLLPVFFGVQPSDLRGKSGSFQKAFKKLKAKYYVKDPNLVHTWQCALTQAANISGFDLQSSALGSDQSRLISLIVKEVQSEVKPKKLFVAKYPVGVDSRVKDVFSLLRHESDYHPQLIGIWGMGGSGKTVSAKAFYNKILRSFDSSCFLANIREDSQQPNGLLHLQEKLLSRLMTKENVKVDSVYEGVEMIRERLCHKKVLLVLDDTDKLSQVDALAGHRDWFGPGSVIIITTRDQHLLNQVEVDERYEAKKLSYGESLKLFSWHSLKIGYPQKPYNEIAQKIVAYSRGLPLALEVLGALLFRRNIKQWNSAFDELQKNPHPEIQKILQISYDGLDYQKREIFLDIVCFFIGMDINYATEILNGCAFSADIGIEILKDRCLLTIDMNNELRMHDLLQYMGREIIRQQCPQEPGKRSRLWSHQDATSVLIRNKGTEAIEGVTLVSTVREEIHLNTESFARMHSLRLLNMNNVNFDGSFEHLPKEIRWISWQGCTLQHLPSNWEMQNLVVLDIQHSKMNTVWCDPRLLKHLKILNLSHSKSLTSTPDFRNVPSLVTLILEGCTSLFQIDPSIGRLHNLLVLNLKGCEKISNIPSEVSWLTSLQSLNVTGCTNLNELPEALGSLEFLRELHTDVTLDRSHVRPSTIS